MKREKSVPVALEHFIVGYVKDKEPYHNPAREPPITGEHAKRLNAPSLATTIVSNGIAAKAPVKYNKLVTDMAINIHLSASPTNG